MNSLTEQAAQVLAEIDEQLAICEKATAGTWFNHDGMVCCTKPPLIEPHERPCHVAKCYTESVFVDKNITIDEMHANTRFIASARTVCPKSLRMNKTAIEGMLEILFNAGKSSIDSMFRVACEATLTTLITQWNSNK